MLVSILFIPIFKILANIITNLASLSKTNHIFISALLRENMTQHNFMDKNKSLDSRSNTSKVRKACDVSVVYCSGMSRDVCFIFHL